MTEQRLTLLYTANLLGRLDRLPRLFSLMRQVRTATDHPTLLLDLGNSCRMEQALCAATEGRAALLIFDAMGYDGACLTLAEAQRMTGAGLAKLLDTVQMALCGPLSEAGLPALARWQRGGFTVNLGAVESGSPRLKTPGAGPVLLVKPVFEASANHWNPAAQVLWLAPPPTDSVGCVTVTRTSSDQRLFVDFEHFSLTAEHHPDATITAAVDFVKEEARLYQRHAARQQARD